MGGRKTRKREGEDRGLTHAKGSPRWRGAHRACALNYYKSRDSGSAGYMLQW
jgi:hypothetical protein